MEILSSASVFKTKQNSFLGYFDPEFFFEMMKIKKSRGDLTGVSARRGPLILSGE